MSTYGRLWQDLANVRARIDEEFPGIVTTSLGAAIASAEERSKKLQRLLSRWQTLEHDMADCDDD